MVPPAGNDPALEIGFRPTASASWATAAWCMLKDSNLHCAGFEAVASAVGLHMRLGAPSEIRTHTARVLSAMPPAVGLPARGAPYRLRSCVCALPKRCPAIERREPGAGRRNRTSDLCLTRGALFQLSYASLKKTDGAPASHLRRAAVARTPSNFWTLTMSNSTAIAGQFKRSHAFARALSASGNRCQDAGSGCVCTRLCGASSAMPVSGVNSLGI
jgi:hypothetical protein